jgi:hypothetical protein
MRSGVPGDVDPKNDEGAAPVSLPPASVSVGAQPSPASVSNSACITYTAALVGMQDKTSVPDTVVKTLHRELSAPRMSRHVTIAGGDERLALQLHAWNAALAASLLPGLHMAEVTIRNLAVYRVISRYKGTWFDNLDFARKLGKSEHAENLRSAVAARKRTTTNTGHITSYLVRDLTFGFWVNIFTRTFHEELWKRDLWTRLPSVPHGYTITQLHAGIEEIRDFRNQVAHHKNLISKPPPRTAENRHDAMMRTLKHLSPQVEAHARAVCTFPLVWQCCPMPLADLEAAVLAMDVARRGLNPPRAPAATG